MSEKTVYLTLLDEDLYSHVEAKNTLKDVEHRSSVVINKFRLPTVCNFFSPEWSFKI